MEETRHRFHEALWELEGKTLDGFELVIEQLDRALESVDAPGRRAGRDGGRR